MHHATDSGGTHDPHARQRARAADPPPADQARRERRGRCGARRRAAACGPEDDPQADRDDRSTRTPKPSAPRRTGQPHGGGTPKPLWTSDVPVQDGGVDDELLVLQGMALTLGDPLTAWDGATGARRWTAAGAVVPGARPLHADGTVYLESGEYDGTVAGFSADTGKETWRSRLGKAYDQPRPIAVDARQVYVTATVLEDGNRTRGNVVAALDTASGRVVWKERRDPGTEENGVNAAVQGAHLVYTDFKRNLTVRDTATGHQVWTRRTTKVSYDGFAVHQDLGDRRAGRQPARPRPRGRPAPAGR